MKRLLWLVIALIFGGFGFFQLSQEKVVESDLVEEWGVVSEIECNAGSRDGAPTLTLKKHENSVPYKVIEEFSRRIECEEHWKRLLGTEARVKVLPDGKPYPLAYDVVVGNSSIYTIEDVHSSRKESGYTILAVSLMMIVMLFWRNNDT